jgi:hypothetical protein
MMTNMTQNPITGLLALPSKQSGDLAVLDAEGAMVHTKNRSLGLQRIFANSIILVS